MYTTMFFIIVVLAFVFISIEIYGFKNKRDHLIEISHLLNTLGILVIGIGLGAFQWGEKIHKEQETILKLTNSELKLKKDENTKLKEQIISLKKTIITNETSETSKRMKNNNRKVLSSETSIDKEKKQLNLRIQEYIDKINETQNVKCFPFNESYTNNFGTSLGLAGITLDRYGDVKFSPSIGLGESTTMAQVGQKWTDPRIGITLTLKKVDNKKKEYCIQESVTPSVK